MMKTDQFNGFVRRITHIKLNRAYNAQCALKKPKCYSGGGMYHLKAYSERAASDINPARCFEKTVRKI